MPRPAIKGGLGMPSQYVTDSSVAGSLSATGSSNSVQSKGIDISINGTFVGTVVIERYIGGGWQIVESFTAPAERYVQNDLSRPHRVRCSAYTSGTINYVLEGK